MIHHGHINILNHARNLADQHQDGKGLVIVGLVSDEFMREYKGEPIISYDNRVKILESLRQVDMISKVNAKIDFITDCKNINPKYVVHGSDWVEVSHPLFMTRQKIIDVIGEWNGILSEIPYTEGISSSWIKEQIMKREYQESSRDYGEYSGSYTSG
jgi:phosphoenolpyruvate phosphomutase